MKRYIHATLSAIGFVTALLLAGCNAASFAGPDEAPQAQSCEDDSCSNGHNF